MNEDELHAALGDPQPAGPTPGPDPSVTRPAPRPTPSGTGAPADAEAESAGAVLRPYPSAPVVSWTVPASTLWNPGDGSERWLIFGDVTATPHSYPGFRAVAAGDTWLLAVGEPPLDEHLVAVDAATGAVRWRLPDAAGDDSGLCAGAHDGLLVCSGAAGAELRDHATGAVVRTIAASGYVAMADGALVTHGRTGTDGTDLEITVTDLTTGAVRAELVVPGVAGDQAEGADGHISFESAGPLVSVSSSGEYEGTADVRAGRVLGAGLSFTAVRADGWVTGVAADGVWHAAGPDGQDVVLPGTGDGGQPAVWAPDRGVVVPLFAGSDPGDGLADQVSAVDPGTGGVRWSVPGVWSVPAVVGRTAVLSGDELVAVDLASGTQRWRAPQASVVGSDGARLVVQDAHALRALDLRDGSVVWTYALSGGEAHVVDGTLVVTAADRSLSALTPP